MENITKEQLQKLHVMLNQMGLIDEKVNMVYSISNGRTTSSRDLTKKEGQLIIKHLSENDPNQRMRKKIFALAYEAGIIYDDSPEDKKINPAKLNMFLRERGAVKKELNAMNKTELVKVVSQFQQIAKHTSESKASKATKGMLEELNISTSNKRAKKAL